MMKDNLWVLIPVYNEAKTLDLLIDEIKKYNLNILVIDDGSDDNTQNILRDKNICVLRNKKNLGKGLSLKKGIDYILRKTQVDYIILMDGDGQHLPSDLVWFIREAQQGKEFVVGNRMRDPYSMPKIRLYTNMFMSSVISYLIKQNVPDTQCGFRMISSRILRMIKIEARHFEIESELIIKAANLGIEIQSIPIKTVYCKHIRSKINPVIDTIRFIRFMMKCKKEGYF